MRGPLPDLASPHPLGQTLPALYRADPFTQRLCEGLDVVLAPVICTLDNLPAYLDVATAPDDLLPWLAHWLGIAASPAQQPDRQRDLLRSAGELHGWLGTRRGIELAVEALLGTRVEVVDSGGSAWAADPSEQFPGSATPVVEVRVLSAPAEAVDPARVEAVVAAIAPAHVRCRVQVLPAN